MTAKIVSAYRGMASYAWAARGQTAEAREALWRTLVVDPYWHEWAAGQFNEARMRERFRLPYADLEQLLREAEGLAASGIEKLVAEAHARIMAALPPPFPDPVLCLAALDPACVFVREHMNGVLGNGVGENTLLELDPTAPGWQDWVPFVLAHEHHHAVWGHDYFAVRHHDGMDLLTYLLNEGQADAFARELFPELDPPWNRALTEAEEARLWAELAPSLGSRDAALHARVMFGGEADGIPTHTGYAIGYHIVGAYLARHPGTRVRELIGREARAILAESGYGGSG